MLDQRSIRPLIAALAAAFLAWVAASGAIVWSIVSSRTNVEQNSEALAAQRDALAYLCETTQVLAAGYRQLALLDQAFLDDPALGASIKRTVRQRAATYRTMIAELSETRPCELIE